MKRRVPPFIVVVLMIPVTLFAAVILQRAIPFPGTATPTTSPIPATSLAPRDTCPEAYSGPGCCPGCADPDAYAARTASARVLPGRPGWETAPAARLPGQAGCSQFLGNLVHPVSPGNAAAGCHLSPSGEQRCGRHRDQLWRRSYCRSPVCGRTEPLIPYPHR